MVAQGVPPPSTALLVLTAVSAAGLAIVLLFPRLYPHLMCYVVLPWRSRGDATSVSEELPASEVGRLPAEQQGVLEAAAAPLSRCGFTLAGYERAVGADCWCVGAIWLDERDGVSAHVMASRTQVPDMPPFTGAVVGFCTEFTDGTAMVTGNDGAHCFRPDPLCDTVRWPGMRDLSLLYRFHVARLQRDRRGREIKLPRADEAARHATAEGAKTMWRQVDAGYFWFDAGDNTFRRTLKGAYLMYWKMQWPWKQRLAAADDRKLRRELASLGFGSPEQYPPDPKDVPAPPALSYAPATDSHPLVLFDDADASCAGTLPAEAGETGGGKCEWS